MVEREGHDGEREGHGGERDMDGHVRVCVSRDLDNKAD